MKSTRISFIKIFWLVIFVATLLVFFSACSRGPAPSQSDIATNFDSEDYDASEPDIDVFDLDSAPSDENSQPDSKDEIVLALEKLDLGWVAVGQTVESDVVLTNGTDRSVSILATRQPDWDQGLSVKLVGPNPVEPGSELIIRVKWIPTVDTPTIGRIANIVISDDKSKPLGAIKVTGGAATPTLEFIPNTVQFLFSGPSAPLIHSLTLKNSGKVSFTLLNANIDCSNFLTERCQRQACPLTVLTYESSEPVVATALGPNEFLNLRFILEVPTEFGCNQGSMKVNIATDIRPEPFSVIVYVN